MREGFKLLITLLAINILAMIVLAFVVHWNGAFQVFVNCAFFTFTIVLDIILIRRLFSITGEDKI